MNTKDSGKGDGFAVTHALRLLTSHKPDKPVDEAAFWDRVRVFPVEPWARLSGMAEKGGDAA